MTAADIFNGFILIMLLNDFIFILTFSNNSKFVENLNVKYFSYSIGIYECE